MDSVYLFYFAVGIIIGLVSFKVTDAIMKYWAARKEGRI